MPSQLCVSLLWSLAGALVGRAFLPLGERLSRVRRGETVITPAAVVPAAAGRNEAVSVLATAALFGLLAWRLGLCVELLAISAFAVFGVRLAIVDFSELRLPIALVLPLYPLTMGLLGLTAVIDGTYPDLIRAASGMVALPTVYFVMALAFGDGIGGGDIRLAGPVGLVLAWGSWSAVIIGTVLAFIYANIALLARIANGQMNLHTQVPFGPAMLGGTFTAILVPWTV